jgi:hypothetical protein
MSKSKKIIIRSVILPQMTDEQVKAVVEKFMTVFEAREKHRKQKNKENFQKFMQGFCRNK